MLGFIIVGLFSFSRGRVLETCKFVADGSDRNREHVSDSSLVLVHPNILSHHLFPQVAHSGSVIILFV